MTGTTSTSRARVAATYASRCASALSRARFLAVVQQQIDRRPSAELQRAQVASPDRASGRLRRATACTSHPQESRPGTRAPSPCGRSSSARRRSPLRESALPPPARSRPRCAVRRRSRGTRCRRRLRTAAPVPRRAARSPAPARPPFAARTRRAPGSRASVRGWSRQAARSCGGRCRRLEQLQRRRRSARDATGIGRGNAERMEDAEAARAICPASIRAAPRHRSRTARRAASRTPTARRPATRSPRARRGYVSTSSRSWNVLPPTRTCRDAARLERLHVRLRHVFAEAEKPAEQDADVLGSDLDRRVARPLRNLPSALVDHPVDERAHRIRKRLLDRDRRYVASARTARAPAARRPPAATTSRT